MKNITKYMGYKLDDYKTPYAVFYNEKIEAIPDHAQTGLASSPHHAGKLPPIESVTYLQTEGYQEIETGYSKERDGSLHVAVLTHMPEVVPCMWDWWFGWHGSRANRYKLWHPKAHLDAQWKDGDQESIAYIGRTSLIEEYIGKKLEKAAIQFIKPTELGFKEEDIADKSKVVYICARIGYAHIPLDFGWLVHQIRATPTGSEMRSRFWLGGKYIQVKGDGILSKLLSKTLQKLKHLPEQQAKDLLIHCSEEMNHLATFLPKIYNKFH